MGEIYLSVDARTHRKQRCHKLPGYMLMRLQDCQCHEQWRSVVGSGGCGESTVDSGESIIRDHEGMKKMERLPIEQAL